MKMTFFFPRLLFVSLATTMIRVNSFHIKHSEFCFCQFLLPPGWQLVTTEYSLWWEEGRKGSLVILPGIIKSSQPGAFLFTSSCCFLSPPYSFLVGKAFGAGYLSSYQPEGFWSPQRLRMAAWRAKHLRYMTCDTYSSIGKDKQTTVQALKKWSIYILHE